MENKKNLIETVILIAACIICAIFIFTKPIMIAIVSGSSMEPTLVDKDILLMNKIRNINDKDIVVAKQPEEWGDSSKLLIKRVVAKPGDELEIIDGRIYVNDRLVMDVSEYYPRIKDLKVTLNNSYFIKGDNTNKSADSLFHYYMGDEKFLIDASAIEYSRNGGNYEWK